jgi:hypothetical protein
MTLDKMEFADGEPPSTVRLDASGELVDRVMAVAHLPPTASVAVIGHHTLPLLLALMRSGCACVRSLRPGTASPDGEAADLAWIVDVANEDELADALQAARRRTGTRGRVIKEGAECACRKGLPALRDCTVLAGFDIVSFDHVASRLVLAPARSLRSVA